MIGPVRVIQNSPPSRPLPIDPRMHFQGAPRVHIQAASARSEARRRYTEHRD
jgi:hypothetical protein